MSTKSILINVMEIKQTESRESVTIWLHLNLDWAISPKLRGKKIDIQVSKSHLSSNLKEMLQELYIVYNGGSLQLCQ